MTTHDERVRQSFFKQAFMSTLVFIARAQVKRAGRKLTVCTADIFALRGDKQNVVATMLATIMAVPTAHAK